MDNFLENINYLGAYCFSVFDGHGISGKEVILIKIKQIFKKK